MDYEFFFGDNTFPYFVNMTNCTGSEDQLIQCPLANDTDLCDATKAAKVYCSGILH